MRAFAVGLLALLTCALLVALSGAQITSSGPATRALTQGIAVLTELDAVLSTHQQELRAQAEQGTTTRISIPTYPLAVPLTPEEVRTRSLQELEELIGQRSASLVYQQGTTAFRSQAEGGAVSSWRPLGSAPIELALEHLTAAWHHRYRTVFIGTLILVALFGSLLLLGSEPHQGLILVGISVGAGALLFLVMVTLLLFAVAGLKNGTSNEITRVFLSLGQEALAGVRRNGVIGVLLGLTLVSFGLIIGVIEARARADQPV